MDTFVLPLSLCIGLIVVYVLGKILGSGGTARPPLPPGPKGLPVVGNLDALPKPGIFEAHHWLKHKELYGTLILRAV